MKRHEFNKIVTKLKKQFALEEDVNDHFHYFIYYKKELITKILRSHSIKDHHENLLAGDLHISRTELKEYRSCHFSNNDLINKFKEKNVWPKGL